MVFFSAVRYEWQGLLRLQGGGRITQAVPGQLGRRLRPEERL